jgi:hypothetical protein
MTQTLYTHMNKKKSIGYEKLQEKYAKLCTKANLSKLPQTFQQKL